MDERTPPHRYVSHSHSAAELERRRAMARRKLRVRQLTALAVLLAVLGGGGAAAWALVSNGNAEEPGGRDPRTSADASPAAATASPAADRSSSGASASPASGASASPSTPAASSSPAKADGTFTGTTVPVLMYHRIEETTITGNNARYFSSPLKFRRQMRALKANGYTAVTLQQVYDYWFNDGTLPAKPIVLSFDDGTSGIAENGGAILREFGWPGVLSVVVPNINDSGGSLSMTPKQIRRLIADGWELDSHSMTHPPLSTVSAARLTYELQESRRRLQEQFDVPVNFFCYPGGDHNAQVKAAVKAAGYLGATTVVRGCADPDELYALDRIEVDGRYNIKTFMRDIRYWEQNP